MGYEMDYLLGFDGDFMVFFTGGYRDLLGFDPK